MAAPLSNRMPLLFSCVGHSYSHLFQPIFYIVALTLVREWDLPYDQVLQYIVIGNILFGVGAVPAGLLADRWSASGMMVVYFLGLGASMLGTAFAQTGGQVAFGLASVGLFASIYHPVGIPWLVRHAAKRGMALGINGVFGGIGPGVGALLGTALIAVSGWRAAFLVPGAVALVIGVAMLELMRRGIIVEMKEDRKPEPPASRQDMVRVFWLLSLTMLCSGLIFQSVQAALPKVFADRLGDLTSGVAGVGTLVTIVYFAAGSMQIAAGMLSDRFALKRVYLLAALAMVPLLYFAASLEGYGLLVAAAGVVAFNVGSQPAENALLARYSPVRWRSLFFAVKFVLGFGVSGLGAQAVAWLYRAQGPSIASHVLFYPLAGLAAVMLAGAMLLPSDKPKEQPAREAAKATG